MTNGIDLEKFKQKAKLKDRYAKQLLRLQAAGIATACIEEAVNGAIANLPAAKNSSLVIYGEPQSGKTEMMICLTAKLLDDGRSIIVHLMNDSVDLLTQNLKRFKASGLAPAAISSPELLQLATTQIPKELVVFCKKNPHDLEKLNEWLEGKSAPVVIDDEADYATPNAKINQGDRTRINELVGQLIGENGYYIGVTATPARLDLNDTFGNDAEKWVSFPSHPKYTGQDVFFPLDKKVGYRLTLLKEDGSPQEARAVLVRFLVTVAYLNSYESGGEKNYTMLVHTSGKKEDHKADREMIQKLVGALTDSDSDDFGTLVTEVHAAAQKLYPDKDADLLTEYVVTNASRANLVVLNSERDRRAVGEGAAVPSSPFTIIIGGNIVSRGVTFPNLLSMFFTRSVRSKLQQDTYIQRARMFGARGEYLEHFELAIPSQLYDDWHRCFIFHRLALATIKDNLGSPVWIGDSRVSVAADSSINKATVSLDKGEMAFGIFDFSTNLDEIVKANPSSIETLNQLRAQLGNDALPQFLLNYIQATPVGAPGSIAIHQASSIAGYGDKANQANISRDKGLLGNPQLELKKFPNAVHHFKIFFNEAGKARLYYKFRGKVQFVQNLKSTLPSIEPAESALGEES
jgi:Z1 domain-containing protein